MLLEYRVASDTSILQHVEYYMCEVLWVRDMIVHMVYNISKTVTGYTSTTSTSMIRYPTRSLVCLLLLYGMIYLSIYVSNLVVSWLT